MSDPTPLPPAEPRVVDMMADVEVRDRQIVEGLPLTVCRTVDDMRALLSYLASSIKSLPSGERDGLLFSLYVNSLIHTGVLDVPEELLLAVFAQRVRTAGVGDDDDV